MKRLTITLALLLILAALSLGCSSAASFPPTAGGGAAPAPAASGASPGVAAAPSDIPAPVPVAPSAESQADAIDESAVALPILTPSDSRGRHLIYTVDLELQTTTFMPGIRMLLTTLGDMNGFVETAQVNGRDMRSPTQARSAKYTMRIHTDRLSEFLVTVEDNFNLVMLRQVSQDVTESYSHSVSTLADLREEESQLRALLEDPQLTDEGRSDLSARLSNVLAAIRSHESHIGNLDNLIRYSTINVSLYEVILPEECQDEEPVAEISFAARFSEAASNGFNGLLRVLQAISVGLIRILPSLLILAIIAFVTVKIVHKATKRNARGNQSDSADNDSK